MKWQVVFKNAVTDFLKPLDVRFLQTPCILGSPYENRVHHWWTLGSRAMLNNSQFHEQCFLILWNVYKSFNKAFLIKMKT